MGKRFKDNFIDNDYVESANIELSLDRNNEMLECWKKGKLFEIKPTDIKDHYMESKDRRYPLDAKNVKHYMDAPWVNNTFEFEWNNHQYSLPIKTFSFGNRIIVTNADQDIVNFVYDLDTTNRKVLISYDYNYRKATTVEDLHRAFDMIYNFFSATLTEREADVNDILELFGIHKIYTMRILELEKKLGVDFECKKINNEKDEIELLDNLYFWIIKDRIIRNNKRLANLSKKQPLEGEEWKVGRRFMFAGKEESEVNIFGVSFPIYITVCHINAVISSIEELDGETIIHFEEKDDKPLVCARRGFLENEDAENEIEKMADVAEQYSKAKYIGELSREEIEEKKNEGFL